MTGRPASIAAIGALCLFAGCSSAAPPGFAAATESARGAPAALSAPVLAAYWESWDDANSVAQFGPLRAMPDAVNVIDVADFEIRNGHGAPYQGPYNSQPLGAGAAAIHARGGKVFLSIGGYSSQWGVRDDASFYAALAHVLSANPGVFDGFDFDDENIPWQDATPQAGQREIVRLIEGTHARWPSMAISYTAFVMGADLPVLWKIDRGEDVSVLRQVGALVAFVNVMEYTEFTNGRVWKPRGAPDCVWSPDAADDCDRDVLREFAGLPLDGGGTLGASRVVMGLEVHPTSPAPPALTPSQMRAEAAWVRTNGYAGVALWSIDRDRPGISGYAPGTFVAALARGLAARPSGLARTASLRLRRSIRRSATR